MDTIERENFNRNSTLIVENTKECLTDLIDLNTSLSGYVSFEDFINANHHEIYHLCYIYNRSRCCQCSPGYVLPSSRILHPSQLKLLLNKNGPKRPCHNPRRTADFCCCFAHRGLTTNILDITLARCLLVTFCQDVFWYSCLSAQKRFLEDFLTRNKHYIFHLHDINSRCCQCPPSYVFPTQRQLITKTQWNQLYSTPCLPCPLDRKRPVGGPQTICASTVTPGITVSHLDSDLSQLLIDHCCPLKNNIESLVQLRNNVFGHIKEARIPENEYAKYRYQIEANLVFIARLCNKEAEVKQKLKDVDRRTLDGTLLMQTIKDQLNTKELMTEEMAQVEINIKEHIDKQMNDLSTTLKGQIKQETIRAQIEEKRKKLLESTEDSVKTHMNENTFVHINAVKEALIRVQQNGIVVLIGPPGFGKSRIGLELLRQMSMDNEKYLPLQLGDITQWQDMCNDMDVVLIDDVFGRTNCSYNDDFHAKLLEIIFTTIQNMNVKVILTLRNNIYRAIRTDIDSQRIFREEHVLDLSNHQMTEEEKNSCLMKYFKKNNIIKTADKHQENIDDVSILDTGTTVYIHKDTIQKILNADIGTHIGFPETCYLFASHRKFTKQGHIFFFHPTHRLLEEIKRLRQSGRKENESKIDFTLLVYILLNDDSVDAYTIDLKEFRMIMESMYDSLPNIKKPDIEDSAERLFGTYLNMNSDGKYCFQHRLISEAIMISYSSTEPKSVIPLLGFEFITEMVRHQNYRQIEGEVIFTVPESCYSLLAQRLLQLLDVECRKERFSSGRHSFVQNLCKSKIITMTGNTILQEIVIQYKYIKCAKHFGGLLRDDRFSKQRSYYYIKTSYFYLPSALLMFCNTDNDSVYQCLYDSIYNTLTSESHSDIESTMTSESDSDVMEACKETLVGAFGFAVSTLNIMKSTVILKILTDHNIKPDNLPKYFCENIVICQGLPGVQLLLGLHGLSHVFNITELLSKIFWLFYIERITNDDNIASVIVNYTHDKLLVSEIVRYVCRYGQLGFVTDVHKRFVSSLLDVDDMIEAACRGCNTTVIQWLMERYNELYNVQNVLNTTCCKGCTDDIVMYICKKGQLNFVKTVCERFDSSLLDVDNMMIQAFEGSNTEVIQLLMERYDGLYNVQCVLDKACEWGYTEGVKVILNKSDHTLLDMKSAMNKACSNNWKDNTELVKWLCEKFDHNLFDMKTGMNEACSSGNTELVKWLCENVDNNLFDMKTGMNKACSSNSVNG